MSLEVSDSIFIKQAAFNPYDLRLLFPTLESLRMAAPDEDDKGGKGEADEDEEVEDDSGSGGTGAGEADKKDDVGDLDKKRLSDEAAKWRRLRREERLEKEKLAARLLEIEGKDKSDAEKLKGQLDTITTERDTLKETVDEQSRELAISRACRGKNVADEDMVGYFLDKDDVEYLDEDGEVADIGDAVEALLKKRPALVATGGDEDEDENEEEAKRQPSGRRTDGKQPKGGNGLDFATLAKKFPALNRR